MAFDAANRSVTLTRQIPGGFGVVQLAYPHLDLLRRELRFQGSQPKDLGDLPAHRLLSAHATVPSGVSGLREYSVYWTNPKLMPTNATPLSPTPLSVDVGIFHPTRSGLMIPLASAQYREDDWYLLGSVSMTQGEIGELVGYYASLAKIYGASSQAMLDFAAREPASFSKWKMLADTDMVYALDRTGRSVTSGSLGKEMTGSVPGYYGFTPDRDTTFRLTRADRDTSTKWTLVAPLRVDADNVATNIQGRFANFDKLNADAPLTLTRKSPRDPSRRSVS